MNTISLSASDFRADLYNLLGKVKNNFSRLVITKHGKAQAVVMPIEEIEAWEETMEIMADKKLMKSIDVGLKAIEAGKIFSEDEVLS